MTSVQEFLELCDKIEDKEYADAIMQGPSALYSLIYKGKTKMKKLNYILKDKKPVLCEDLIEWAKSMENKVHVGQTYIGRVLISTVFLGIDYNPSGKGPPILFETMIFGEKHSEFQQRYETWEMAEAGHQAAVELVERGK